MDCIGINNYDSSSHYFKSKTDAELLNDIETDRSVKRFLSMKKTEELHREALENQKRRQELGQSPFFYLQHSDTDAEESFSNTRLHATSNSNNLAIGLIAPCKSYSEYMLGKRSKEEQLSATSSTSSFHTLKSILKQQPEVSADKPGQAKKVTFSDTVVVQQVDEETHTVNVTNYQVDSNFKLPKSAANEDGNNGHDDTNEESSKFVTWKSNMMAHEKVKRPVHVDDLSTDCDVLDDPVGEKAIDESIIDKMADKTDYVAKDTSESNMNISSGEGGDGSYVSFQNAPQSNRKPNFELSKLSIGDGNADVFMMGDCSLETAYQQLTESQHQQIQQLQSQLKMKPPAVQPKPEKLRTEMKNNEDHEPNAEENKVGNAEPPQSAAEQQTSQQILRACPEDGSMRALPQPSEENTVVMLLKEEAPESTDEMALEQKSNPTLHIETDSGHTDDAKSLETIFQRTPPLNMTPNENRQFMHSSPRNVRSNYKLYSGRGRSRSSSRQRYGKKQVLMPRERRVYTVCTKKTEEFNWIRGLVVILVLVMVFCLVLINWPSICAAFDYVSNEAKLRWSSRLQIQTKTHDVKKSFLSSLLARLRRWMPF